MKRYFIITVDTEGDNLWTYVPGQQITTNNTKYIPRFQEICEKYSFYPVYLVNYEMIMDDEFAAYLKDKSLHGKCEIGIHIHAWNSPPDFSIPVVYGKQSFITEYPRDIQKAKLKYLKDLIKNKTGNTPVSFRSGRWATDQVLFRTLDELGILVDCSITPGLNHCSDKGLSACNGNSYIHETMRVHRLTGNLIEVPMTTARLRTLHGRSIKNRIKNLLFGKDIWLRPATNTTEEMLRLVEFSEKKNLDYLEFMIHSSELMPGGSPYTMNESAVERFYERIESVFESVTGKYAGISLREYYNVCHG